MKSQFSKIVKIRKQKRDSLERDLLRSRTKEKTLLQKRALLYEAIAKMEFPKEGNVSLLKVISAQKQVLSQDKQELEVQLLATQKQISSLELAYQKAHIEYEKMKYLEEQELLALMAKMAKEEQQLIDETSTQLFAYHLRKKANV